MASRTDVPSRCTGAAPDGCGITVGPQTAAARIVLNQESQPCTDDSGETSEHKIGAAPSQHFDQQRGQRRHHKRADADAAHCQTGSKPATPHKPTLYRANRGDIGAADTEPDAKSVSGVYFQQAACGASGCQTKAGQHHPGHSETAWSRSDRPADR